MPQISFDVYTGHIEKLAKLNVKHFKCDDFEVTFYQQAEEPQNDEEE